MATGDAVANMPNLGLGQTAEGGYAQNTGAGEAPISLRSGILTTNEVYFPGATDAINIRGVARISLWISFVQGSLTNIILRPSFAKTKIDNTNFREVLPIYTAGSRVIDICKSGHLEPEYTMTVTGIIILPIINPGASWFRLGVQGTGTVDASSLTIHYTRSYVPVGLNQGIMAAFPTS